MQTAIGVIIFFFGVLFLSTNARARKAPVRRKLQTMTNEFGFHASHDLAANDHREMWDRTMWLMPFHYWVTLRRGKRRLMLANEHYR